MNTNNTVKKALAFNKGLTNVPSDFVSTDDELTESVGMIMKNGEMTPIQYPTLLLQTDKRKLMFVHKTDSYENIIFFNSEDHSFYFYKHNNNSDDGFIQPLKISADSVYSVVAVNNTLIAATDKGTAYILFDGWEYKFLGYGLPFYEFSIIEKGSSPNSMGLPDTTGEMKSGTLSAYTRKSYKITDKDGNYIEYTDYKISDEDHFNQVMQGTLAKTLNAIKKVNGFAHPFFIRVALRLYDGTYAKISTPQICFPCISRNMHPYLSDNYQKIQFDIYYWDTLYFRFDMPNLSYWKDIVRDVVFFASEEVLPYSVDDKFKFHFDDIYNEPIYDIIGQGANTWEGVTYAQPMPEKLKSEKEMIEDLISKTHFYKIADVPLADVKDQKILNYYWGDNPDDEGFVDSEKFHNQCGDIKLSIRDHVIENLTSQEQLPNDDYFGWTQLFPTKMYSYNKRLNIYSYHRRPYEGNRFLTALRRSDKSKYPYPLDKYTEYTIYVHIKYGGYDEWVSSKAFCELHVFWMADSFFYYPDPHAVEVRFVNKDGKGFMHKLKQHPRLNGAYCFDMLPHKSKELDSVERPNVSSETKKEFLDSQILTSVVNNPFVFQADGDNTVGTGSILGVAANTEPISQGQFGQYPLMVFTSEGIYGLSVNSEGLYAASYPMSREVCNNANSITPTDRLVFFTSEKGLMAISGGSAVCVSTMLQGPTPRHFNSLGDGDFRTFLKDCMLAYDYRESLIRIYSPTHDYHYVYNMLDQTFAKAHNENTTPIAVVSSYPDHFVQEADGKVYSMLSKPDINADTRTYSGTFITRPLKLGSSLELKTIRQIIHFFHSEEGDMQLRIFASNDCRTWRELKSIHGKPWLFYTLQYNFSNLKASDSFSGSVLAIEIRFNDKMR